MALLGGGYEVKFEGFASMADLVESLEQDNRTLPTDATSEQVVPGVLTAWHYKALWSTCGAEPAPSPPLPVRVSDRLAIQSEV